MKFEFYIASKLRTGGEGVFQKSSTPSLNIAVFGMTLAVIIMILSINIICGFKNEISNKIYGLDSHIRIYPNQHIIDEFNLIETKKLCTELPEISNTYLVAEKPAILKTNTDFKGVVYRGVTEQYDWNIIDKSIINGISPINQSIKDSDIFVSQIVANQLNLSIGDKVFAYFIDDKIKVRKTEVVGIFNTNFEELDNNIIIGNIKQLQSVNEWNEDQADYIGIKCHEPENIELTTYKLQSNLNNDETKYSIIDTFSKNIQFFTWLELLDMNVIIIIVIMLLVTSFTLISSLLMIVLERINMIGLLKSMGAQNKSIRMIFIFITNKLILKSIIIGNILAIGISVLQSKFHIINLDPNAYYISFVPISINWGMIILLNIGIIVVSYLSLLAPSHIITKIEPSKSIIYE